jgi:mycothiol synthase
MTAANETLALRRRAYAGDDDYWRIRNFLRELLLADDLRPASWLTARWDYWRWHGISNVEPQALEDVVHLWQDTDERVVAVANAEGVGQAFLQVRPEAVGDTELIRQMLEASEETMAAPEKAGQRLTVWIPESRPDWRALVADRGYHAEDSVEHVRAVRLASPPAPLTPAPGYIVRAQLESERQARGIVSWQVFHPTPDGTTPMTDEGYRWIERCPLYRRDLDLVAVAPDGSLVGFCTVWFDDATRTAMVEPMGVLREHRGKGLAKSLLVEGLRRVAWLGATVAYVGSYAEPAHSLYASAGMQTVERLEPWTRGWLQRK